MARRRRDEVQMRRPHVVTLLHGQEIPARAVDRHAVASGLDAFEPVAAVFVRHEHRSQVHVLLMRILILVQAAGRGLPGFQASPCQRRAVQRTDAARHAQRRARRVVRGDLRAVLQDRLVGPPEGPDQRRLGSPCFQHALGVHQQHQRRHAQDIGQQDALVPQRVCRLPDPHQEIQALVQFFVRQRHVGRERMKVADQ
ncbi:hypothetical protein D3C71_1406260 [compost metagenome]